MCPAPLRKPYPSDVSDEEWSLVVPYLTLMTEAAPQRDHSLRELFNALRYVIGTIRNFVFWRAVCHDQAIALVKRSPNRTANCWCGRPPTASICQDEVVADLRQGDHP